ncbi:MAG: hypothetical protein BWY70_01309 [Bacteroidetes bacterium ADurb.Bin408]|nr:MAG: hypothetical protein BWY70_01309 [Bacteroidetes bacterium ADurb.Bin408]
MKRIIFLLPLLIAVHIALAQEVLLKQDVDKDTLVRNVGPNLRHYHHTYFSYGFAAMPSEKGADIKYGNSSFFDFGYRYKLKICNHYAVGTDFNMGFYYYNMMQNTSKVLPDTLLNDKENFNFSNLSLGLYNRINFGKRGNYVGNFLDLGAYGLFNYSMVHFTKNHMPDKSIVETRTRKLGYYNMLGWGLTARLGFNRYIITANYRMSNLFKTNYNYPELSRLTVGFQIGFY